MQFVYASHVSVRSLEGSTTPADVGAREAVRAWAAGRLGIEIQDWRSGEANDDDSVSATWSSLGGDEGQVSRLHVSQTDSAAPWNWDTTIWVGVDSEDTWVRTRIGVSPRTEGVVVDPSISVGAPRFLAEIANSFAAEVDGRGIETYSTVRADDAREYIDFLLSPERQLPIVALTRPSGESASVSADSLSRRLSGIAHVVAIEPPATYHVSERITPTKSVFGGAARIYWPGFTLDSAPFRHPLFLRPGARGGPEAFINHVVAQVGRAAGFAFGPPALESVLRRAAAKQRASEARKKMAAEKADREGGLSREEFEAFSEDYEKLERAHEEAQNRIVELEAVLDQERLQNLGRNAHQSTGPSATTSAGINPVVPTTVREAVEMASELCRDLVFTQSAFESADASRFDSPEQVLADLRVIQEVANRWARGDMDGDFKTEFSRLPVTFRSGISSTAATSYASDYTIVHRGKKQLLGPHIRRGVGSPRTILRIYWFKDDESKKLVIGHVGKKLRDGGNRN